MTGFATCVDPGMLFLDLWAIANARSSSDRLNAQLPPATFDIALARLLAINEYCELEKELATFIGPGGPPSLSLGQVLATMVAIDKAFAPVHPRSVRTPAFSRQPGWLLQYKLRRIDQGFYAANGQTMLFPRGPLTRLPREEYSANAETLSDRFSYLGVGPLVAKHEGRNIEVLIKVIGPGVAHGLPPSANAGVERIGFIPIAEGPGDLQHSVRNAEGLTFVDFKLKDGIDPAARFTAAVQAAGKLDVAIAPELVMAEKHLGSISGMILGLLEAPALLVAGSGATESTNGVQAWNEACAFNSVGALLWRQRKIWQAGITRDRAIELGLPDPGDRKLLHEDNASGDSFVVCDVPIMGRIMIFICQDIHAKPMAVELISSYQPDWIVLPILDPGINKGGWVHQRAMDLSGESRARFLICCSTSLRRASAIGVGQNCGMTVGPKAGGSVPSRVFGLFAASGTSTPHFAVADWGRTDDGMWEASTLGGAPLPAV